MNRDKQFGISKRILPFASRRRQPVARVVLGLKRSREETLIYAAQLNIYENLECEFVSRCAYCVRSRTAQLYLLKGHAIQKKLINFLRTIKVVAGCRERPFFSPRVAFLVTLVLDN